jgi:hypothetical protein
MAGNLPMGVTDDMIDHEIEDMQESQVWCNHCGHDRGRHQLAYDPEDPAMYWEGPCESPRCGCKVFI